MIVITGGIGCGKSAVCRLLSVMGHTVYDCDREAKRIMLTNPELRQQLSNLFGTDVWLNDGTMNRTLVASRMFGNADLLRQMNALVHPAVARDVVAQAESLKAKTDGQGQRLLFVETAIHFESGFDHLIHPRQVWCVAAPDEVRIARAMKRDNATRERILARIGSQMPQDEKMRRSDAVILNDDQHSVIGQVNTLLNQLMQ